MFINASTNENERNWKKLEEIGRNWKKLEEIEMLTIQFHPVQGVMISILHELAKVVMMGIVAAMMDLTTTRMMMELMRRMMMKNQTHQIPLQYEILPFSAFRSKIFRDFPSDAFSTWQEI
jgi:hypothetical protein